MQTTLLISLRRVVVGFARFVQHWQESQLQPVAITLIVKDLHDSVVDEDRDYFRASREKRVGMTLEQRMVGRDERVVEFRNRLEPLRRRGREHPGLGGERPLYSDYTQEMTHRHW